jgi:hypothetical protein
LKLTKIILAIDAQFKKKKVLVYPSNIATLLLMLKHRPYSVAIRFKDMSSYYDHVYKIEELNHKGGREVKCMFLGVVHHLAYDNIEDSLKTACIPLI